MQGHLSDRMRTEYGPLGDREYATLDVEKFRGAMRFTSAMLERVTRDPFGNAPSYYDTSKNGDEGFFPEYGHILLWRSTW